MKIHALNHARRSSALLALAVALLAGCGGSGSSSGSTTTNPNSAPKITSQPKAAAVTIGGSATFSVSASGTGTVTYQWYKNGGIIEGATSSTFTIDDVTTAATGSYFCKVTDNNGSVNSAVVTLTIASTTTPSITSQPADQSVPVGSVASFTVVATGATPIAYQWSKDGTAIPGATDATYKITPVAAGSAGSYTVTVTNSYGSVTSNAATLAIVAANAPSITTQPHSQSVTEGGKATFSVQASGVAPLTYQWYKDGSPISGATSSSFSIDGVSDADGGQYYVVVTNGSGSTTSSTAVLTVVSLPVVTTQPTPVTVDVSRSTTLSVQAAGNNLSYQWYKDGKAISGATGSSYTISQATVDSAGQYKVLVRNSAGSVFSDTVLVTVVPTPTITGQPSSTTVGVGGQATFTVTVDSKDTAGNTVPVTYQWYKGSTAISGATSASYQTPAATSSDNKNQYYVVVSNEAGSTQSNTATLTVDQAPSITAQPSDASVSVGSTATFSVTATASGVLSYQWYKNGSLISGATSNTYTTPATTAADNNATFHVIVYNDGVISVTSRDAKLTVH